MYAMQGHSTATSLPPLPENGETEETQVQVVDPKRDQSPIPSATTSHAEEVEEEAAEEVQTEEKAAADQEVDRATEAASTGQKGAFCYEFTREGAGPRG